MENIVSDLTCDCRNRVGRKKTKNELMVVFQCEENIQFFGFDPIVIIAGIDGICMMFAIFFIWRLNFIDRKSIYQNKVEFSDFTMNIKNLEIEKSS